MSLLWLWLQLLREFDPAWRTPTCHGCAPSEKKKRKKERKEGRKRGREEGNGNRSQALFPEPFHSFLISLHCHFHNWPKLMDHPPPPRSQLSHYSWILAHPNSTLGPDAPEGCCLPGDSRLLPPCGSTISIQGLISPVQPSISLPSSTVPRVPELRLSASVFRRIHNH